MRPLSNFRRTACVALAVLLCAPVVQADPLQDLLNRIRTSQVQEDSETRERLQRFRTVEQERKALLKQVLKDVRDEEETIEKLERGIEKRQKEITASRKRLQDLSAHYQESFAIARLWAVDLHGQLHDSLISTEFPGRAEKLLPYTREHHPLTIDDLRQMMYYTLQEIEQQGLISRFTADVSQPDGSLEEQEVVRIGAFTASSGDFFLRYLPQIGNLQVLPRQPRAAYQDIAAAFQDDPSTEARLAVMDPTRGTILALLTDIPTFREIIDQGGAIGYLILLIGSLGMLFAIYRIVVLSVQYLHTRRQYHNIAHPQPDNPLGRVALVYYDNRQDMDPESLEDRVHEAVSEELPKLAWGLNMLRMLAAIAPLLGLLGTVVGMIQTFQAITLFGTGDPRMMAGGISHALVTTALGLSVAIPLLLLLTLARSFSNRIRMILEEHTLGLLARVQQDSEGK